MLQKTIMFQGIKQQSFLAKEAPTPSLYPPSGKIPGQMIPLLPEALIKAKGWEWPGEEISHWTDLANHILCSAHFLGI